MDKIKVMLLISSLTLGGAEKYVLYLARVLKRSKKYNPIIACLGEKGVFYNQALEMHIPILLIKRVHRFDFFIIFRLYRILKQEKITILHSHMYYANIIGRIAGYLAQTPVIISTEHGLSYWKNKILIWIDRATHRLADKIITVSNISKETRLKREKIEENRIITIHNFVDTNKFYPTTQKNEAICKQYGLEDKFVIGMVTRLTENKRIWDAIYAMKILKDKLTNSCLVIVGDGPLRKELMDFSNKFGTNEQVIFTGFVKDVNAWLNIMDVVLLISIMEDFPLCLLEAMAVAKPIIATNVGGIPEIVINNETGKLIPVKNYKRLADSILQLAQDPNRREEMGRKGIQRVRDHFSVKTVSPKILALYEDLLNNKIQANI